MLACFGNAAGPHPHFNIEDTRHGTVLDALIVGDTASARKGTSYDRAFRIIAASDPDWGDRNNTDGGLSSAEGLIHAVRDPAGNDLGVEDKRLLAAMGEFAETLTRISRNGNALGSTLRNAWDGKTLVVRTRSLPLRATGAHVSVIGHITQADLAEHLAASDVWNGFANRFLWVVCRRSQNLPFGGKLTVDDMPELVTRVRSGLEWAQERPRSIEFGQAARTRWPGLYDELLNGQPAGLEAITDRAAAQVRRLALVYAVADRSRSVGLVHLRAALEIWRYSEASVEYVFGDAPPDQAQVLVRRVLSRRADEWVSRSKLYREAIKKKITSYRLDAALEALVRVNEIERRVLDTGGRPRTEYRMKVIT